MYRITYGEGVIYDPFSSRDVFDVSITGGVNACSYLTFTLPVTHPLLDYIQVRALVVRVQSDGDTIFEGQVTDISEEFDGTRTYTCADALSFLANTVVRPYSTVEGEAQLKAPAKPGELFAWYIEQHNSHMVSGDGRFEIGVNDGFKLDKNDYVLRSSEQHPTTASEIQDKILDSLGGYLFVRYGDGTRILDLYADVSDVNTQIIDFGVNMTDYAKLDDTKEQYTAIIPSGGTPEGDDQAPVDISSLPDGAMGDGFVKRGDVIYHEDSVLRYGYNEFAWNDSEALEPENLAKVAIAKLTSVMSPTITIEVTAVDMAVLSKSERHLVAGQAVRVRCRPRGVDEYLMVQDVELDLLEPANTKFTLGASFDTLTGQQSAMLRSLNASINASYDAVIAQSADIQAAAEDAQIAYTLASDKRRVFYTQPKPPYDKGDLWVQGESGDIFVCVNAKEV